MIQTIRYPTGVRPLLVEEAALRRGIESRFVRALEDADFGEILLPIIDYFEPYAQLVDRAETRQSYRFTDREGELISIRSDFTPMVARALAPSLRAEDLPLRVFYRGDVVRCEPTRLGASREMFQIGGEIIGDGSIEADVETLRLCAMLARLSGAQPRIIYSGAKTIDVPDAEPAPDDDEEPPGYYTALRFTVYDAKTRRRIARGGRYDDLYGRFGTPAPAVGFTFTLEDRCE